MANRSPDFEQYEKALEQVLEGATKDFWVQYVDINRHQVGVARTYLWVAAALLGAYLAAVNAVVGQPWAYSRVSTGLALLASVLVVCAFGVCLYAMPARQGYKEIAPNGWGDFSTAAYRHLNDKKPLLYTASLSRLIDHVDAGVRHNLTSNSVRAKLLRVTSWLLIGSFVAALASAAVVLRGNMSALREGGGVMSEEKNDVGASEESAPAPPADQPATPSEQTEPSISDVPVPGTLGPSTTGPTTHTHSDDRVPERMILTDTLTSTTKHEG